MEARVRRILTLAGYDLRLGTPGADDDVVVWGHSPHAPKGEAAREATGAHLVRVEDAFLRSLSPGRTGEAPLGLVIDRSGMYFDASRPSDLETLLATHPLDDTALLNRARDAVARIQDGHLSKYSAVDPGLPPPDPGYVLLIDQTRGDASIKLGGANADSFGEMLAWAQEDHPDAELIIKTHPETEAGHRPGHFNADALPPNARLLDGPHAPTRLFEGARAVYCVTSQMGFEAILAGHRPQVFGTPFYAGWGLSDDRRPAPTRRQRTLTRAQMAAACLILYPTWYDPYRDRLGEIEDVLGALEAQARAWREDRHGYAALGMSRWKRRHLTAQFGAHGALAFKGEPASALADGRPVMIWAGAETETLRETCEAEERALVRVEDGVLRSRGLGARLVPPLSLVRDPMGIYYDPARESLLERLIGEAARLPRERLQRAETLVARIVGAGLTKYSLDAVEPLISAPEGREVVLVPGQVEDDASIRLGAGEIADNARLLAQARALYPEAWLLYRPHPDVSAGLRPGVVPEAKVATLADQVVGDVALAPLLARVDRVVTITSTLGFEALLRGVKVTVLGTPFYAGWGLTRDLGAVPLRRQARPSVAALAHAVLITYPRYHDPLRNLPCPPEVAVERLISGEGLERSFVLRMVARLQGWLPGRR